MRGRPEAVAQDCRPGADSMLLQPRAQNELAAIDRTADALARAAKRMFAPHVGGLETGPTAVGSFPVFTLGDRYVAKLYAPIDRLHFETECAALRLVDALPDLPAPRLVDTAQVDGWSALLMTRVKGKSLTELWPALSADDRHRLCRDLGRMIGRLHATDPSPLVDLSPDWESFVARQAHGCVAHQIEKGLDPELAATIPTFLATQTTAMYSENVFLHTEVMRSHVFAAPVDGRLEISGLIDFEPAMVGDREYELASVGLFVAGGDTRLLRSFLDGYGKEPDPDLHRRIMAFTLLHRYSNLRWYMDFMPAAGSLEQLARRWFATD